MRRIFKININPEFGRNIAQRIHHQCAQFADGLSSERVQMHGVVFPNELFELGEHLNLNSK